jgi:hypothetical protein
VPYSQVSFGSGYSRVMCATTLPTRGYVTTYCPDTSAPASLSIPVLEMESAESSCLYLHTTSPITFRHHNIEENLNQRQSGVLWSGKPIIMK